jgi:hypothetical protein
VWELGLKQNGRSGQAPSARRGILLAAGAQDVHDVAAAARRGGARRCGRRTHLLQAAVELLRRAAMAHRRQHAGADLPVVVAGAIQDAAVVLRGRYGHDHAQRVAPAHPVAAGRDAAQLCDTRARPGGNREIPDGRRREAARGIDVRRLLQRRQPELQPAVPPGDQLARQASVHEVARRRNLAVPAHTPTLHC